MFVVIFFILIINIIILHLNILPKKQTLSVILIIVLKMFQQMCKTYYIYIILKFEYYSTYFVPSFYYSYLYQYIICAYINYNIRCKIRILTSATSGTEILFWQHLNWVAKYRMTLIMLSWLLIICTAEHPPDYRTFKNRKPKKNYQILQTKFFCEKIEQVFADVKILTK